MDKKFKRETRQTGMTDERQKGIEKIRELKNTGMSGLDQLIQVRYNYVKYVEFIG